MSVDAQSPRQKRRQAPGAVTYPSGIQRSRHARQLHGLRHGSAAHASVVVAILRLMTTTLHVGNANTRRDGK